MHLSEIDDRKVEIALFDKAIRFKADQNAINELKKQMIAQHNNQEVQLIELHAKIDYLRRDQGRIVSVDDFQL